jgi:hypothetical protein
MLNTSNQKNDYNHVEFISREDVLNLNKVQRRNLKNKPYDSIYKLYKGLKIAKHTVKHWSNLVK